MEVFNNLCQKNKTTMSYGGSCFRSSVGRFVSADTIVPNPANPQSFNRFSYGYSNPVKYIDPTGHYTCTSNIEGYSDEDCYEDIENLLNHLTNEGGELGETLVNFF